ncbi:MAG: uracil-DNA glycosylase, partial [Candidatus Omnitrophota bacterium]
APGENEDREGRAFVGRAGRLLDAMMKETGFDTDRQSLIINIVKCRPPENRKPAAEEAEACSPFLKKQLELVKPEAILLLGATALRHMIHGKKAFSMGKEAGNFFTRPEYPGVQFMVLYHPAYILRDPRKRPTMEGHLRRFKAWWDEKHPENMKVL